MNANNSLSGTWISVADTSTVEFTIRKNSSGYRVTVKDSYDGEVAAVSEEKYDNAQGIFSFATYWSSTGRFTRYRMGFHAPGKLEITFTHTDSEILIRKDQTPNKVVKIQFQRNRKSPPPITDHPAP